MADRPLGEIFGLEIAPSSHHGVPSRLLRPFLRLDALTVLHAPSGYGKSAVIHAWADSLATTPVTWVELPPVDSSEELIAVCLSTLAPYSTVTQGTAEEILRGLTQDVSLVVTHPEVDCAAPLLVDCIRILTDLSPRVHMIVETRCDALVDALTQLTVSLTVLSAELLRYTAEDLSTLYAAAAVGPRSSDEEDPHAAVWWSSVAEFLGGVPALCTTVLADTHLGLARSLYDPAHPAAAYELLQEMVDEQVISHLPPARTGVGALTAGLLCGSVDAALLDTAHDGACLFLPDEAHSHLRVLPVAAAVFYSRMLANRSLLTATEVTAILDERAAAGDQRGVLVGACTAGQWSRAMDTALTHLGTLVARDPDDLVQQLLRIPSQLRATQPHLDIVAMLLAVIHAGSTSADLRAELVHGLARDPGTLPVPAAQLWQLVEPVFLRLSGTLRQADQAATTAVTLLDSLTDTQRRWLGGLIPLLRVEWQLCHHLVVGSTVTEEYIADHFLTAYHEATAWGMGSVQASAAALYALSTAEAGHFRLSHTWLERAEVLGEGFPVARTRTARYLAIALHNLVQLRLPQAQAALQQLPAVSPRDEFGAHHLTIAALVIRSSGELEAALDLCRWATAQEPWRRPGSLAQWLVATSLCDSYLAMGLWQEAAASVTHITDRRLHVAIRHGWFALLAGDVAAAEKHTRRVLESPVDAPAAKLYALILGTQVNLAKGDIAGTAELLSQAFSAARQDGNISPLLLFPAELRAHLAQLPGLRPELLALWSTFADAAAWDNSTSGVDLSAREQEILHSMSVGATLKEIAERSGVSVNTVKTHVKAIYKKLGVHSRSEARHRATELRLLSG